MKKTIAFWFSIFLFVSSSFTQAATIEDCKNGDKASEDGQYEKAVYLLSECITLPLTNSGLARAHMFRGDAYYHLDKFILAIEDGKKVLALEEPEDVWPFLMLGYYYRENKQYQDSLEVINKAVNYDEDGPGTGPGMAYYYHKGLTLHELGRFKEAIESYTLGIPKQPDYGSVFYSRGLTYEAMGDKEQAKRDFMRAYELAPEDGYDAEIANKLKEYGFNVKVYVE